MVHSDDSDQVIKRIKAESSERISFWCLGCKDFHTVKITGDGAWGYNGSDTNPTISPSILVTSGHYLPSHVEGNSCWCKWNEEHDDPDGFKCFRCHSFITDGMIQYLNDCSHSLGGQTIPLPPHPNIDK